MEIIFETDPETVINVNGVLIVAGTETDPVILTKKSHSTWLGIDGKPGSEISIDHARFTDFYMPISTDGGSSWGEDDAHDSPDSRAAERAEPMPRGIRPGKVEIRVNRS